MMIPTPLLLLLLSNPITSITTAAAAAAATTIALCVSYHSQPAADATSVLVRLLVLVH